MINTIFNSYCPFCNQQLIKYPSYQIYYCSNINCIHFNWNYSNIFFYLNNKLNTISYNNETISFTINFDSNIIYVTIKSANNLYFPIYDFNSLQDLLDIINTLLLFK